MAGSGHNSLGMDADVFDMHVARMALHANKESAINAQLKEARKEKKRVRKLFQADGGVLGDLDVMIKERSETQEAAMQRMERQVAYGRRLGTLPQAAQLDMFEGITTDPGEEKAYDEGKWAGLWGKSVETCPHEVNHLFGQKWIEGWHVGQAVVRRAQEEGVGAGVDPLGDQDNDDDDDAGDPDADLRADAENDPRLNDGGNVTPFRSDETQAFG